MIRRLLVALFGAALLAAPVVPAHADPVQPTKVIYVGDENMGRLKAFKKMPYLKSLAAQYGDATSIHDSLMSVPSLPHYLLEAFGTSFGVKDDGAPRKHSFHGQSIYGNAVANGRTAKVYVQSASANCVLANEGPVAVRHNGGLPYALDERGLCAQIAVPLDPNLQADIDAGALPNVGWIATDLNHDAHRPSTPLDADNYLRTLVPELMAGPDYQSGNLVIVISTDEASGTSDPMVPFVVIHPNLAAVKVTDAMDQLDIYRMFLRYGGSIPSGQDALQPFGL